MKGFTKGVVWTLGSIFLLVVVLAIIGMVAYSGYNEATLKYSKGDTETSIKLEKKDIKKSTEQASFTDDEFLKDKKELVFKESGPFFGIKKNGRMFRGIYIVPKNETAQTDFYGLFTKDEMFWKGYSKHTYNDGKIVYQYNEYQLDSDGKVIVKDGIYQLEDTYTITADDFEKVKKYIRYDIPIPFSFYNFDNEETIHKLYIFQSLLFHNQG